MQGKGQHSVVFNDSNVLYIMDQWDAAESNEAFGDAKCFYMFTFYSLWCFKLFGQKKTFAVNFLRSKNKNKKRIVFSIMDEYIFSVLLFDTHICSYSTTEKYCKNGETWAW